MKAVLRTYVGEDAIRDELVEIADDYDGNPYGDKVPFAVGSNQTILNNPALIKALTHPPTIKQSAQSRTKELEAFVINCRDDFDCDEDAHKYGTTCRACSAKKLIP